MRRVENLLSSRERDPGESKSDDAGVALLVGETRAWLVVERLDWPVSTRVDPIVLKAGLELSVNGGVDWKSYHGIESQGGITQDERGNQILADRLVVTLPEPSNPNRRLRVRAVSFERLRTAVHLDLE